jgi:lipoate-protein ligase A
MRIKDISFATPQENLDFDDALLQLADKHEAGECLRFWESPSYFIVLGRIGRENEDVDLICAQQDNISVLRRSSGGGTVIQGPGCLNYTLVLSKHKYNVLNDLRKSYAWISERVINALEKQGVGAYFRPISDLAMGENEKKFSGNAQKRGKNFILHHGTILYSFDLSRISRYLKMPQDIPEYRKNRPHTDFVTNISIDPVAFKQDLSLQFNVSFDAQPLTEQELSFLNQKTKNS